MTAIYRTTGSILFAYHLNVGIYFYSRIFLFAYLEYTYIVSVCTYYVFIRSPYEYLIMPSDQRLLRP